VFNRFAKKLVTQWRFVMCSDWNQNYRFHGEILAHGASQVSCKPNNSYSNVQHKNSPNKINDLVYSCETSPPMKMEELRRLERAERMILRWICEVTLKKRCKSEESRKCLDMGVDADVVRKKRVD